ncbi:hypothetical protein M438DRAFT_282839 [Aureobasidium pullulans EXF-150]|uniref:Uncharacterized protein n=1 Tax=Aureobasidium pullulans EXF-150 TaxID=1043002 RepID=A0A074X7S1_AURPU|nr:uncharacterized protein M438DRAFT_282839 [Aureobasidium pullulans EXF-150]KEQ79809.1 hypothetical protein M438DRAFT_282839 [Aureobasidium pullulans EXF-150]
MALGFVDAIGLLGTGLGIIQFGLDNFVPDQKDAQGTIVGIKGGDGAGASNTLGGKISKVYAYNSQNVQLGTAGSQTMAGNADYLTYTVDQDVPGAQGQYVGIQNGNDATCIAWITVKMFDNSLGGAWTGDIGRSCGQSWFESQEVAGQLEDGSVYRPSCTWLDGNHDNEIPSAALKFSTYSYGPDTSHVTLDRDACASTIFAADEKEIKGNMAKRSNLQRRARLSWMEQKLVISNIPSHSATNLCNSETSWGPDFADSYGMLCDMGTKTLYTLCSKEQIDGCVNISTEQYRNSTNTASVAMQQRSIAKRTVSTAFKTYEQTSVWGDNN